jgi:NAD(P) transhydrogenase subunit alpha
MEIFVTALTIFVLAIFVGFEVITKVPPTLHTPLMSGSKAAVIFATINVVGGFLVTDRMLKMFKKK